MTRSDLLAELYRRLNYGTSPAADVTTRLASYLNLTHRQLLTQPGMDKLRDSPPITFASVDGTREYALPQAIAKIKHFADRTNQIDLSELSLSDLRAMDPGLSSVGGPSRHYVRLGWRQVATQPSNASEIFVDSTSASDTGTAYIEAIRTGGYRVTLSVTMTGTTAVSLGTAYTDIIEIDKFYISAAAAGTVTLHEDSGAGTELARIPIGATYARYEVIQLWPTPNSAVTYHVDFTRHIPDLTNANDEPLLPPDFHWLLVEGALVKEWTKRDDLERRKAALQDYAEGLRNLRSWVMSNADTLVSLRRTVPGMSQLGGWYPRGT